MFFNVRQGGWSKSLLGIGCFKVCCNDKLNKSYTRLVFGQVSYVDNVEQHTIKGN